MHTPTKLTRLPDKGKIVLAHSYNSTAAEAKARELGTDYLIYSWVGQGVMYVLDIEALVKTTRWESRV